MQRIFKQKEKISNYLKGEKGKFTGDLGIKAIAELINAVSGILTFSILARMLSKSDYAVSNQLILLGMVLAPIILLKINSAYVVFFPGESNLIKVKSRFFSSILLSLPVCLMVVAIFSFNKEVFSTLMFGTSKYGILIPTIALFYVIFSLSTLIQDFYRAIGDIRKSSLLVSSNAILRAVLFLIFMNFEEVFTIHVVILIYCLTEFLIMSIGFFSINRYFKGIPLKINFSSLKEYYAYSFPLIPYLILSWINTSIGKFIINHLMDLESSGIYTFNNALVVRVFILNTVVGYTIFPYISKFWNSGDKEKVSEYLTKAFNIGIFFGFPITFGLLAVLPTIVTILSGNNYPVDRVLIGIFCASMIFNMLYSVFGYLIDLSRKTILYTMILLFTSILNILLNFILIPKYELYGAAITLLITYGVQAILTILIGTKSASLKLKISIAYIIRCLIVSLFMFGITSLFYNNSGLVNFSISVFIGAVAYLGIHISISKMIKRPII